MSTVVSPRLERLEGTIACVRTEFGRQLEGASVVQCAVDVAVLSPMVGADSIVCTHMPPSLLQARSCSKARATAEHGVPANLAVHLPPPVPGPCR